MAVVLSVSCQSHIVSMPVNFHFHICLRISVLCLHLVQVKACVCPICLVSLYLKPIKFISVCRLSFLSHAHLLLTLGWLVASLLYSPCKGQ